MTTKKELMEDVLANREMLGEVLSRIKEADLERAVYPGGWNVKELLSHLAALNYLTLPQLFLSPPTSSSTPMDINALNQHAVERRRENNLAELREEINQNTPKIVEMLTGLGDAQLATPVSLSWIQGSLADVLRAIIVDHERAHLDALQSALLR